MECLYNTFISNKNKSHCNCCHHFALFGPDSVFLCMLHARTSAMSVSVSRLSGHLVFSAE